jgi:hypothetical protein
MEMTTMSTSLRAARAAIGSAARVVTTAASMLFAVFAMTPSQAAPVEYVKICSLYGAGFFYMPGTDTCLQSDQIVANQFAIARASTRAATGTAMAASLVNPFLPDGTNFAVSAHWAGFDGQHAVGLAGLIRLRGNLTFTLGLAAGLDRGKLTSFSERRQTEFGTSFPSESWSEIRLLGRAGLMFAW